jgi:radical SAM superfamily enzyme YgiQ (UPF0313 family)
LEAQGIPIRYFDERLHSRSYLKSLVCEADLSLVGISSMTCYQIISGLNIAAFIKKVRPEIPIVWGGIHPSMCPEQTIESSLVDLVIRGEGELTLLELARAVQKGKRDYADIAGLVWHRGKEVVVNAERPFLDFNRVPLPYSGTAKEMLGLYLHRKDVREPVGIQTSRGCRFRCAFCYNRFFNKNAIRLKKLEIVKKELQALKKMGVTLVLFYDDNLGYDRERVLGICEIMRELGMSWSADLSLNFIDDELVRTMERSGCSYLFFGIESPSDVILRFIHKGQTNAQIKEGVRLMSHSTIKPMYSLMTGFPGFSGQHYLSELIDFANWVHRVDPRAEIGLQPYTPYPGTPLYAESLKRGFKEPKTLNAWGKMTMDHVHTPWVKNKAVLRNLFLLSFLAFRYEKFLKGSPSWLFHKIALFRWRHKWFHLCVERLIYDLYTTVFRLWYKIKGS